MAVVTLGSGDSNFTARQAIFVQHFRLGENTTASTVPLNSAVPDTYRFAIRMPTLGRITRIVVNYKSCATANTKLDFSVYGTDWVSREANDIIYQKNRIDVTTLWDDDFGDKPLAFSNRVAHTTEQQNPRNFLWMECKPDAGVDSVVLVDLYFEV